MNKTLRILMVLLVASLLGFAGAGCTAKAKMARHRSRADHYYQAGKLGPAEIEYLNVLRYDLANPEANTRLGLIYYEQGRLQRANYFLGKASQLAPENLELRLKLGFIESSMGQFATALEQANLILDKKPQDDEAPLLLAEASTRPKDIAAARQRLESLAHNGDRAALEVALGDLALHEHDLPAALAAFNKAQALDPKSAAVNAALGTAAWAQDDLKQAEADFQAAAKASPARSPRRMQYVRFKIQTGDLTGARAALAEILQAAPDYVPASLALAEIAAHEKKYDESAGLLEQILKLDPDNFDARFFQGRLDLAQGNNVQAVADMEQMVRLYPQVAPVHYQLGSARLAANDPTQAAASFSRALELNPNYTDATLALAQIQIKSGNADPAISALEHVQQQQPGLITAQLLLAEAYRLRNRVTDALAVYRALESRYPTNEQVALLQGVALLQAQDRAGARKAFERVLQLSPGDVPAMEQLVDLDLSEKQFAAAAQLVNGALQANPKAITYHILSAKILVAQGLRDQAEAALSQAIAIEPTNQVPDLLLAELYSDSGRNEKALAELKLALAKGSENLPALMLAARIYGAANDQQDAADAYEKLLKLNPKYSPALNNLAYIYSEYLNHLDRAYELAQRARELLPSDPATADTLGWICFKRGSYAAAAGLLKEAAAKLTDPEVQGHFGQAAYMTADEPAARAALQGALQAGTNFTGQAECQLCLSLLNVDPATANAADRARLEKRVAEKKDDPVALVRLAHIYEREDNPGKAIAAYEAALQVTPNNLDALLNLSRLYADKDLKKAYELAKAAAKLAPYDPAAAHALGRLAFLSGDYQLAAGELQQAMQGRPNDALVLFDYAQAAYGIGKVSAAQSALQSALAQNLPPAQAASARQMLDMIALAAAPAQAAAAQARIEERLKSAPDDPAALMARAAASQATDPGAAAQACEKVLARYPDFVPAQIQLAWLDAADPAKLERANTLAVKAQQALPDDPAAAKLLGVISAQRGDYNRAVILLKQSALTLNTDAQVFYYLGMAQFHLKNRAESKASLQQALDLNLSGPLAESARQMLGQLK